MKKSDFCAYDLLFSETLDNLVSLLLTEIEQELDMLGDIETAKKLSIIKVADVFGYFFEDSCRASYNNRAWSLNAH